MLEFNSTGKKNAKNIRRDVLADDSNNRYAGFPQVSVRFPTTLFVHSSMVCLSRVLWSYYIRFDVSACKDK